MQQVDPPKGSQSTRVIVVDNRVFLLGLDELYRQAMKQLESGRLLDYARTVARRLRVGPKEGPVEGYYTESPELTEYFHLVRALQDVGEDEEVQVAATPEFELLWELNNSGLFGDPVRKGKLLPVGRDPLYYALKGLSPPEWNVPSLVSAAYDIAFESDQYSLVSLAARARDAVAMTALTESVTLYRDVVTGAFPVRLVFDWRVDDRIAAAANRFITVLNRFVGQPVPEAKADNAEAFYNAYADCQFAGRCVRIGKDKPSPPVRHYHWAIQWDQAGGYVVDDFWDDQVWTTERYQAERYKG